MLRCGESVRINRGNSGKSAEWGGDDEARVRPREGDALLVRPAKRRADAGDRLLLDRGSGGWIRDRGRNTGTTGRSRRPGSRAQYGHEERAAVKNGRTGGARSLAYLRFRRNPSRFVLVSSSSANPHCRFPACRARQSHITSRVTRDHAYACQISRRGTHVTSIKFILTAILLVNLSFVPWFCPDWPAGRTQLPAGQSPSAFIQRHASTVARKRFALRVRPFGPMAASMVDL